MSLQSNGEKPDFGADVLGISGDLEWGLGRGPKQQAVNQSLVLQGYGSQDVGQGEDDVIVGTGSSSAERFASQVCRAGAWHFGQCRFKHESGLLTAIDNDAPFGRRKMVYEMNG